jgi:hypothetical protein
MIEYKPADTPCPSCFDLLKQHKIDAFESDIIDRIPSTESSIAFHLNVTPIFDLTRVISRTVSTGKLFKSFPFSNATTVFEKAFVDRLRRRYKIVGAEEAQHMVYFTFVSWLSPYNVLLCS